MNEIPAEEERREPIGPPTVWEENHGNLLLAFVGLIVLVGASILAYRQFRFVPPTFPGPEAFDGPADRDRTQEASAASTDAIEVVVTGAANDSGSIMLAIYGSEKGFNEPSEAILLRSISVTDGEGRWSIQPDQLPDRFAIAAYHDENGDDALNRNRFGIPTERYGYSRNARALTGPPSFDEAVIDRPETGSTIQLFVR